MKQNFGTKNQPETQEEKNPDPVVFMMKESEETVKENFLLHLRNKSSFYILKQVEK